MVTIHNLKLTGYDDMVRSIFISNKKYTPEIEDRIQTGEFVRTILSNQDGVQDYLEEYWEILELEGAGTVEYTKKELMENEHYVWYRKMIEKSLKIACGNLAEKSKDNNGFIDPKLIQTCHTTIGRFLDISCTVSGLHRGATDDFDAHGQTLDNRIVRMSTRTNSPDSLKLSDYYIDKVIPITDAGIELPPTIEKDGVKFVISRFGYVREDCASNYDVLRGLTPLGISNLFTFKCNVTNWAHITKLRKAGTHAAPELQEMIETINAKIAEMEPCLNDDFWTYLVR